MVVTFSNNGNELESVQKKETMGRRGFKQCHDNRTLFNDTYYKPGTTLRTLPGLS